MKVIICERQLKLIENYQSKLFDIKNTETDYLNLLCTKSKKKINNNPFCNLKYERDRNYTEDLKKSLDNSLKLLYDFFGHKYVGVFPKIIELSLENKESTVNFINLIGKFIKEYSDEKKDAIRKNLKKIIPQDIEDLKKLEKTLGEIRMYEHQKYERSFIGDVFVKNRTSLRLNYNCGKNEKYLFSNLVRRIKEKKDKSSHEEVEVELNDLKNCIRQSIDSSEGIKSDLKTTTGLYVNIGDKLVERFPAGSNFEVKMVDTGIDLHLSEFFAIFKNIDDPQIREELMETYNFIIDELFKWIKEVGGGFLEKIKKNTSGIIFDNNILVPMEFVEIYWSNKGQRDCKKERRLSIRFKVKPKEITAYKIVDKNTPILEPVKITPSQSETVEINCQ